MLLKFIVSNYRSFKDEASLDLEACSIKEHPQNVFISKYGSQPISVLKSVALLGANSSGKSNLFKGFELMRDMVINSAIHISPKGKYIIEPFKLNTETENKPSVFEATIMLDNFVYRYGFKANNNKVFEEWLYMVVRRREETIFIRTENEFDIVKKFPTDYKNKLLMLTDLTRSNALYLSVLTQFNIDFAMQITNWFAINEVYTEPELECAIDYTLQLLDNPVYHSLLNEIIERADLGFSLLEGQFGKRKKMNDFNAGSDMRLSKIEQRTNHVKYDAKNKPVGKVSFNIDKNESSGVQKLIALLGPMMKVLIEGGVFWIDDFDAKIHPYIITMVMDMFNSEKYNQNDAQLIVISYNQQILKKLRRDQIVFLNKNAFGASSLSALYIYNPHVRSNAFFDREYLQGLYGGVPNINGTLPLDIQSK